MQQSNVEKWIKNFKILIDVSTALGTEHDNFRLLELIVTKTTTALNAERSSLFLLDKFFMDIFSLIIDNK